MLANKLIVILGPTSSGKSSMGIKLAKKFHGEIISADSRQVYKGLDIGTGKVPRDREFKIKNLKFKIPPKYISSGVPHHLLDVASPKKQFTVTDYKQRVKCAIAQITRLGKVPFLVGGTAFYIYAVVDDLRIPKVKPNLKLRNLLRNKTTVELFAMLKKLDPERAKTIDCHNPHRLIRAIEIVKATGHPVPQRGVLETSKKDSPLGQVLILGIKKDPKTLKKLIHKRVKQRFKQGLITEVKKLLRQGITLKRLKEIGLIYRLVANHLQLLKNTRVPFSVRSDRKWDKTLIEEIATAEYKFSKRQMTWFKRDKRIKWIKHQNHAELLIKNFLKTNGLQK